MAAKRRAAAKGKRSAAAVARPLLQKRAAKVFSPAAKAKFASYSATRCSQSKACALAQTKYGVPTADTQAYCSNRQCTIICKAGFLGPQADGSCIASTVTCPTPPAHGIYSGASCTLTCDTAIGYEVVGSVCLNVQSDTSNCGSAGTVCAKSYNGVGTSKCASGACSLTCPAGRYEYYTASGHYYCG